ncbi:MAG: hypothetical protein HFJ06_09895 [Lachnospiraceae bacterium]|nr:hypothetical protein [Lachnospiraceae bacterium]
MKEHSEKMIAPIVITVLFIVYYYVYFIILLAALPGILLKLLFGIIPIALAAVMIFVCVQRMKEIRSGEEDDLSQY